MNNKGFTLIELLAVLIILAIIAVITTPIVVGIIIDSRENSFITGADNLYVAALSYYDERLLNDAVKIPLTVVFDEDAGTYYTRNEYGVCSGGENIEGGIEKLDYKGKNPTSGKVFIDRKGNVKLALWNEETKTCVIRNSANESIKEDDSKTRDTCTLDEDDVTEVC